MREKRRMFRRFLRQAGGAGLKKSPVHREPVAPAVDGAGMSGRTAAGGTDAGAAVGAFDLERGVAGPFLAAGVATGGHGRSPASASLRVAAAWYFLSSSTPSQLRPSILAASRVEPDPANGSRTVSRAPE